MGLSGRVGLRLQAPGGNAATAKEFVTKLYKNVPVLDSGARGSTTTFVERGVGDVLLSWENEAYLAIDQFGKDKFEIVYPSISILAEPPVALVDKVVDRHGTRKVALEYLKYLYTAEGQGIAAKQLFTGRGSRRWQKYGSQFPQDKALHRGQCSADGKRRRRTHFADGGVFDQIYQP